MDFLINKSLKMTEIVISASLIPYIDLTLLGTYSSPYGPSVLLEFTRPRVLGGIEELQGKSDF